MGFGESTKWFIGKNKLSKHGRNKKLVFNPYSKMQFYIIPLFRVGGKAAKHQQTHAISISIRNPETFN
jgi:hypothetical protein